MQKKKRKKRLRVGRLLFLLLLLAAISFAFIKYVRVPIRSINITGNNILTDQEIIDIARLDNYPSYFEIISLSVKKRISKNEYVNKVRVRKGFLNIKIKVEENKVLYIDQKTNEKVMLNSKIKDDKIICVPYLTSAVRSGHEEEFKKAMNKIDSSVLCKMSEIKYDPNEIDEDRYYVNMNDGNGVYLTINKFKKINKYDTILESIGKENGILYLDYGDYFKPY